jgi:hypothetical protein
MRKRPGQRWAHLSNRCQTTVTDPRPDDSLRDRSTQPASTAADRTLYERQIDALVYELCGLAEDAIVEGG